jgi:subtilisin family serine protease
LINSRDDTNGGIGVAPLLWQFNSLRACKNVSDYECPPGSVAAALQWAIELGAARHVVNISIGYCHNNLTLQSAVQAAVAAGILVVASAGNRWLDDPNCPSIYPNALAIADVKYPARYSGVLAVGGSSYANGVPPLFNKPTPADPPVDPCASLGECNQTLQGFGSVAAGDSLCQGRGSRSGPEVALVAPFWALSMSMNGGYAFNCGTSFSAPLVSGVAALVWARYPNYSASQVKSHLQASSVLLSGGRRLAYAGLNLPPLAVGMSGPQAIEVEGTYGWTVTPPAHWPNAITYEWFYSESASGPWQSVGFGSSYFRYVSSGGPSEFWIKVVASSGSASAFSTRYVTNAAASPCYPYECE